MDSQSQTFARRLWSRLTTRNAVLAEIAMALAWIGSFWISASTEWGPRMGTGTFLLWNLTVGLFVALLVFALGTDSSTRG